MPGALEGVRTNFWNNTNKMHNQEYLGDQPPRPYKSLNNVNNNNHAFSNLETASTCSVDAYASHLKAKRSPYAFSDFRCDYSDMELDSGPPRPPDPEIYSPPVRHNKSHVNDSMTSRHYRGRLDRQGGHRRTWSPPAFSQALSLATQLKAQRIYRSNDQLDNEAIYEELPDGPAPPRLPLVSGQLQDAERPMIKPVAYKPVMKSSFQLMGSQQGLAPPTSHPSPTMVSPTHSHSSTKSLTSPKSALAHSKPLQLPLAAPKPAYRVPSQTSTPKPGLPSPTVSGLSPTRLTDIRMNSQDEGYVSQECNFQNYSMSSSSNLSPPSLPQTNVSNANVNHSAILHQQQLMSRSSMHPEGMKNSYSYHGDQLASYQLRPSARSASYGDLTESVSNKKENRSDEKKVADRSTAASLIGLQTPSPSDSGVGELEAMLRDKDAEIAALRETMAANENAMMKVHEEKRQNWEMEMRDMSNQWESRLRMQQQKTFRMEQALLLQLFKIQQERKTLRLDCEQLRTESDLAEEKIDKLSQDLSESQSALEELRWDMCQKTGEISLLKKNVKQSNEETTNRSQEVINVRSQAKELHNVIHAKDEQLEQLTAELNNTKIEMETLKAEMELLKLKPQGSETCSQTDPSFDLTSTSGAMPTDVHVLQQEVLRARTEIKDMNERQAADKRQWLDEKNKVIRYQKHLQLNYVQMYKKNRSLETEIEQLMVELENRDLRLTEVNPHGPNSPQESMC